MTGMLEHALGYARRGWPVFPCHPKTKHPLVKAGFKAATTDEAQIRAWWGSMPDALIACPMGEAIGAFVVDLDIGAPPLIEGLDYLKRFGAHVGGAAGLPYTAIAETASGGIHVYFAWDAARPVPRRIRAFPALDIAQPEGASLPGGKRAKNAGIDILGGEAGLGSGGYAIVPPSRRADGKEWTWLQEPWDGLAPAPEAVYAAAEKDRSRGDAGDAEKNDSAGSTAPRAQKRADLGDRPRRYALSAFDAEVRAVAQAPAGRRNQTLFEAALKLGTLVGAGALTEAAVAAALEAAAKDCGLWKDDGAKAVRDTIASGLKKGIDKPRTLPDARPERSPASGPAATEAAPAPPTEGEDSAARSARAGEGRASASQKDGGAAKGGATEPPQGGVSAADAGLSADVLERLAGEPLNDLGNARRLIGHFGGDMMVVREVGEHAWAGTHWEPEGGREAFMRWAHIASERIALEAPLLVHSKSELEAIAAADGLSAEDLLLADRRFPATAAPLLAEEAAAEAALKDRQAAIRQILATAKAARGALQSRKSSRRKFSIASGNAGRLAAMVEHAKPYVVVPPDAVDADPLAINVLNGTLRVVRVPDAEDPKTLVPEIRIDGHRREDRLAKLMPVAYDPAAAAPKWRAFIERFQPDATVRRFLQQFHGYALTGLMGDQLFVFNYGTGANGKSTFMELLGRLQGPYARVLPAEALQGTQQRRGDQASPEFARLPGARLVRAAEFAKGEPLREATVKLLTGGEKMLARHLNKGFFEFTPTFKAIGSGNEKPPINAVNEGIWRRVKLVPWPVMIPPAERRPMEHVLAEFAAEGAGILNWLLEGLVDYLANGLVTPEAISVATAEYRADMDPVGEFTGACVKRVPGKTVPARSMYEAYTAWCHANSVRPFSERRFSETMATKGFAKKSGRIREYLEVELGDVPEDPEKRDQSRQGGMPWGVE